jgi:hypothetical protein
VGLTLNVTVRVEPTPHYVGHDHIVISLAEHPLVEHLFRVPELGLEGFTVVFSGAAGAARAASANAAAAASNAAANATGGSSLSGGLRQFICHAASHPTPSHSSKDGQSSSLPLGT